MCGIAGIFRLDGSDVTQEECAVLRSMNETLLHRGPDGTGLIARANCALAATRLGIQDPSVAAAQPMVSPDGQFLLVFNGEIYNFVELREELVALGIRFRSTGDTEVVLAALRVWGPAALKRLCGMWGLAAFDVRERQLFLSRDRLGIKPLYWFLTGERLVFASEVKALLRFRTDAGLPIRMDAGSVATYLATGVTDAGEGSMFEGISRFPAGSYAIYRGRGSTVASYWSLAGVSPRSEGSDHDEEEQLRDLLGRVVGQHLRSDARLGFASSGGLDSSSVLAVAAREHRDLRTYTIRFDDWDTLDGQFASILARELRAEATECAVDVDGLMPTLARMVWNLDEPSTSPATYSHWCLAARASQDVRVILSGQGGDELFAGYVSYFPEYFAQLWAVPKAHRLATEVFGSARLQGIRTTARLLSQARERRSGTEAPRTSSMLRPEAARLVRWSISDRGSWPAVQPEHLNNVLYWEVISARLPRLLRYEDRICMAFSLESRVPLLDHRIVEFVFGLPARMKIRHGWSKWLLRRSMRADLPSEIAWRRDKTGFPNAFSRWLAGPLRLVVRDRIHDGAERLNDLMDTSDIDLRLLRHDGQQHDEAMVLWRALSLVVWADRFSL